MTSLITLLIALLGYGTPTDFSHLSEDELNIEITNARSAQADDDGGWGDVWDTPDVQDEPDPDGGDNPNP